MSADKFAHLHRLADVTDSFFEVQQEEGINISGAFLRNGLVNLLSGDKVPVKTYTVAVSGRGSLIVPETEFRDLLAAMIKVFEMGKIGYVHPTDKV